MLSGIRNAWFQVFLPRIFERKDLRFLGIRRTLGGMIISGRKAHEVYRLVTWLASLGDCFRSNRVVRRFRGSVTTLSTMR